MILYEPSFNVNISVKSPKFACYIQNLPNCKGSVGTFLSFSQDKNKFRGVFVFYKR